ncbi:uncharacterized protein PHACADRAFT_261392 [Phanerochaete carnosa HHB-10118-sp]|uniref:Uncharacterized protein n=1 Tax=Phanerochaete carnosa (strain HHB-10118-sp) TaxID=650164 RepID=K5W1L1_PHACS|nr:uncharacterized protein PHACADRAFT_261392 [Phanerochaete carnosa HHB-10118-sp]EKM52774.1 hypothetical protein PHACADRAFT_261392 [Phanerochaete carnosa HHB-10118-sp]
MHAEGKAPDRVLPLVPDEGQPYPRMRAATTLALLPSGSLRLPAMMVALALHQPVAASQGESSFKLEVRPRSLSRTSDGWWADEPNNKINFFMTVDIIDVLSLSLIPKSHLRLHPTLAAKQLLAAVFARCLCLHAMTWPAEHCFNRSERLDDGFKALRVAPSVLRSPLDFEALAAAVASPTPLDAR